MKKRSIIILVVLLLGLTPLKYRKETTFYNDYYRIRLQKDKVGVVEILEPLEYEWEWKSEDFNESGTHWQHFAMFWSSWIITRPEGGIYQIRLILPGRHGYYKWLGLGTYTPVLMIDCEFDKNDPNQSRGIYFTILSVDYEQLVSFGWSEQRGWGCSFCTV